MGIPRCDSAGLALEVQKIWAQALGCRRPPVDASGGFWYQKVTCTARKQHLFLCDSRALCRFYNSNGISKQSHFFSPIGGTWDAERDRGTRPGRGRNCTVVCVCLRGKWRGEYHKATHKTHFTKAVLHCQESAEQADPKTRRSNVGWRS